MKTSEKKYAFRERIDQVHPVINIRPDARKNQNEIELNSEWSICSEEGFTGHSTGGDLLDFFRVSLGLNLKTVVKPEPKTIVLEKIENDNGFSLSVSEESILIRGNIRRGAIYLEDLFRFREAPFAELCHVRKDCLFSPRMVHSAWGLDQYPDSHLNAIVHAGFDSILLFVKAPLVTTFGAMDFNDLIRRAAKFGIGVYFYSYLDSYISPDDPAAEAFFDSNFGKVFEECPLAKGLIIVGESACFPTKDPHASPRRCKEAANGDARPCSGWWPCTDYPDWLNGVKKAVRKYSPDADIVFWSYNWGRQPVTFRQELIARLPKDVSLQATFEMYEVLPDKFPNHQAYVPDYTITFPGPGFYFSSEAEAAKANGLRLYSMTNTGGRTWDCGVIPYIPVPMQWIKRFKAMVDAHYRWGLCGLMESHHYGWHPCQITECAKHYFLSPEENPEEILRKIAVRDYGKTAAPEIMDAWQLLSNAVDSYIPGFDDQNGPLRIGPAYPLLFRPILHPHDESNVKIPFPSYSFAGRRFVQERYMPEELYDSAHCGLRMNEDIRILGETLKLYASGLEKMRHAICNVPADKKEDAVREAGVAEFFYHTLRTMRNTKHWWVLNMRLEVEPDFAKANALLDELDDIAADEYCNAEETLPLTDADSRLGWEPSMEYLADSEHIRWKLRQVANLRNVILPKYRESVCRYPKMNHDQTEMKKEDSSRG